MKDELNELELNSANNDKPVEENDGWKFDGEALTLQDTVLENAELEINIPAPKAEEPKKTEKTTPAPAPKKEKEKMSANKVKFIVTGIVMAIVIVILTVLGIFYYNAPNSDEKMNPGNTALTVGDTPVSIGMYNYYYSCISTNYISYAGYGYYDIDTTKPFDEQKTTDSDGNETTWADLFEKDTIDQIQYITAYYEEAVKAGVGLTDDQKDAIDQQIESLKSSASEAEMSVDEYISSNYGKYCGMATLKKMLEQCYIAENYYQQSVVSTTATDDEINAYYEKHSDEYKVAPFAYLQIAFGDNIMTQKEAEKKAKDAVKNIKTVEDMKKAIPTVCKESLEQYVASGYFEDVDSAAETLAENIETSIQKSDESFTEKGREWLFNDSTKVGDCNYFVDVDNSMVFVVLKTGKVTVQDSEVYSVRHILIMPKSDEKKDENAEEHSDEPVEYTKEQWAEAKKSAEKILEEYNKGDKTEVEFARLAEEKSEDTESTSKGSSGIYGGLYEGTPLGAMVKSFEEWATDDKRAYGDVDIVKSEYGYHIMFFVEDTKQYLYDCKKAVIAEKEKDFVKSVKIKKHKNAMKKTKVAEPDKPEENTDTEVTDNAEVDVDSTQAEDETADND